MKHCSRSKCRSRVPLELREIRASSARMQWSRSRAHRTFCRYHLSLGKRESVRTCVHCNACSNDIINIFPFCARLTISAHIFCLFFWGVHSWICMETLTSREARQRSSLALSWSRSRNSSQVRGLSLRLQVLRKKSRLAGR